MVEAWIAAIPIGYLIGSIPVGLWVGRYLVGVDVRAGGSGKIGATNAYRRLGLRWSIAVFVADVSKGVIPLVIVGAAFDSPTADVIAPLATLIGHIYPVFAGFSGGRAAATGIGAMSTLNPVAGVIALAVGVMILGVTRIMSLSVLLGMTVGAIAMGLMVAYGSDPDTYLAFTVISYLIVSFAHRDNIQRLATGSERVLGRAARPATVAAATVDAAGD
ncbi:MAG TPA: glycerol-3-phosphate 1-O-acyltransferase PlsY [Dehalococcoidia bacterium]|nr:glycerol-3-phosphate 1-O-acyltransferase PlsY [Dehalococcoidia bacterium]